ncbi:hypothetical protein AVEN_238596-1 [Araneus ventricosus]|uniref:Secreted protein n=1 Tax=Araneus ventricosus TaxID=182803 RepID=A0A4Y2GP54_ARAVE|nr:hypothetical protein AVEN_238596-1 [Araneus ventricosus]
MTARIRKMHLWLVVVWIRTLREVDAARKRRRTDHVAVAYCWAITNTPLHTNLSIPSQNRPSVRNTDEKWSGLVEAFNILAHRISARSIWTTGPNMLQCERCRYVGEGEGGSLPS